MWYKPKPRVGTGRVTKKQMQGRILRVMKVDGREFQYHATKGWRSRRA